MSTQHATPADDALDACLYAQLRAAFFARMGRHDDAAFWQSMADQSEAEYARLTSIDFDILGGRA